MDHPQYHSNAEVIKILEGALAAAKVKRFASVSLCLAGHGKPDPIYFACFGGETLLEEFQASATAQLAVAVKQSADGRKLPPRDERLDESHVCYNLALQALSFDFLNWLVDAEMTRVRAGAPAPLKVAFFKGVDAEGLMRMNGRVGWLDNVFRPAMKFVGAVEDDAALLGWNKEPTVLRDVVRAARAGERVPMFKTDKRARSELAGAVTITLREAEHNTARNSLVGEWIKFAGWLQARGEKVVFVRDTAKALEPFGGFATCPEASLDLAERLALYESAKLNFFAENGPVTLAVFGTRPWVSFVDIQDDSCPEAGRTPFFWKGIFDLEPGDQYPWAGPDQRIVWKGESFEAMVEAWEAFDRPALRLVRA